MTTMLALGALEGGLLAILLRLLIPRRVPLSEQLARFENRPASVSAAGTAAGSADLGRWVIRVRTGQERLGREIGLWLARRGVRYQGLRRDLALTGITLEAALARKAVAFLAGFVLGLICALGLRAAGLPVPALTPAALALGFGIALFFMPDVAAHRAALTRRREFRQALGSWLDLVALEMAASAAPAEALPAAARIGGGWAMILIRETLYRATVSGQDHWEALTELGSRLDVAELSDLGALTRLVGRDGAQVRETLSARASAMRRALLADAQAQAGRADQSMLVAQVLIGLGFVVFVMYPAIVNVMSL